MRKVSIVIPVYNMGDKIETCVQSLFAQTYKNIEIIIVDDGSKDDSLLHCKNMEKKDPRVRVFHTENRGSGPARNYGIDHSTGEYIYFPDADDYIEPNTIELLEKTMDEGQYDLIVFGYRKMLFNGQLLGIKQYPELEKSGKEIREDYSDYMTTMSPLAIQGAPWNKFFKIDVIRKFGINYPELRRHQDEGFIARYMNHTNRVRFMKEVLYTYFTNDLNKEWDKYPLDYIQAVKGLYEERKNNIMIWNLKDERVHSLVRSEYICGCIKSLELSFSPKYGFSKEKRLQWMTELIKNSELLEISCPKGLRKYHNIVFGLIKKQQYRLMYHILYMKVAVEKSGLFEHLKHH